MRIIKNDSDVLDPAECIAINCCSGSIGAFLDKIEDEI